MAISDLPAKDRVAYATRVLEVEFPTLAPGTEASESLQVWKDTTLHATWKAKAKQWHPDRNPQAREEAEARFKEVTDAYEYLRTLKAVLKGKGPKKSTTMPETTAEERARSYARVYQPQGGPLNFTAQWATDRSVRDKEGVSPEFARDYPTQAAPAKPILAGFFGGPGIPFPQARPIHYSEVSAEHFDAVYRVAMGWDDPHGSRTIQAGTASKVVYTPTRGAASALIQRWFWEMNNPTETWDGGPLPSGNVEPSPHVLRGLRLFGASR